MQTDSAGAVSSYSVSVLDAGRVLSITAPLPPTLNQTYKSYRAGGTCRIVTGSAAKTYKADMQWAVRAALLEAGVDCDPDAHYGSTITQRLRRDTRDVDANVKLVIDAIFSAMGVNDKQVRCIVLRKDVGPENCVGLTIEVAEI